MYSMEPPEPKWINQAHLLNYDLCREDQMGTNPNSEIPKKI